jgi:hypothetical protein
MFLYNNMRRNEYNDALESHRDPLLAIFFIGGMSGVCIALHFAFSVARGYTNDQIFQFLMGALAYTGMMSIGLYRAFQLIRRERIREKAVFYKTGCVVCVGSLAAFLGALPLGFIDYSGAELIGLGASLPDFFRLLKVLVGIGALLSFWIGFLLILFTAHWPDGKRFVKCFAIMLGSLCAGICIILAFPVLERLFLLGYVMIFGIFFSYTFTITDRRGVENGNVSL